MDEFFYSIDFRNGCSLVLKKIFNGLNVMIGYAFVLFDGFGISNTEVVNNTVKVGNWLRG